MKEDCMVCLKVYLGIEPYDKHQSRSSGQFLLYIKEKYGEKLMQECYKEIEIEHGVLKGD